MGVTGPALQRIPMGIYLGNTPWQDAFEAGPHPLLWEVKLSCMSYSDLAKLQFGRMPDDDSFNLSQQTRRAMWQAEWDKRTLLRPAHGVHGSDDLLRAAACEWFEGE